MVGQADSGLACVPSAIPAAERAQHFALAKRLFLETARERQALPNGYAFRFEAVALGDVVRFVENERKCCPFMKFQVDVESGAGPLWLRMTGPDGTREVLDAELNLPSACGCGG
jgi:hypothetical protein